MSLHSLKKSSYTKEQITQMLHQVGIPGAEVIYKSGIHEHTFSLERSIIKSACELANGRQLKR